MDKPAGPPPMTSTSYNLGVILYANSVLKLIGVRIGSNYLLKKKKTTPYMKRLYILVRMTGRHPG